MRLCAMTILFDTKSICVGREQRSNAIRRYKYTRSSDQMCICFILFPVSLFLHYITAGQSSVRASTTHRTYRIHFEHDSKSYSKHSISSKISLLHFETYLKKDDKRSPNRKNNIGRMLHARTKKLFTYAFCVKNHT